MEKFSVRPPIAFASTFFSCSCGNGPLFVTKTGQCNTCMGMTEPDDFVPLPTEARRDRFDMDYFEALERMFESFDFAA